MPPITHHVLWTGGWDSTFRVVDLLLTHGRAVQPWYVVDPSRRTTGREQAAMAEIATWIGRRDPRAGAHLAPVRVLSVADIRVDPVVREAATLIRQRVRLPEQYVWLAELTRMQGLPALEVGIEHRAETPALAEAAVIREDAPAPEDWWVVTADGSPPGTHTLYGLFRLPILEYDKADLGRQAAERGFSEALELTWFCRWPTVFGNPCGFCVPCQTTRLGGLGRRVPEPTRPRQALHDAKWEAVRVGAELRARTSSVARRLRGARVE